MEQRDSWLRLLLWLTNWCPHGPCFVGSPLISGLRFLNLGFPFHLRSHLHAPTCFVCLFQSPVSQQALKHRRQVREYRCFPLLTSSGRHTDCPLALSLEAVLPSEFARTACFRLLEPQLETCALSIWRFRVWKEAGSCKRFVLCLQEVSNPSQGVSMNANKKFLCCKVEPIDMGLVF